MSHDSRRTEVGLADDEREVAELLALAGRRPEMPAADTAEVEAAAREAWQQLVARQRERRRFATRSNVLWIGVAAAALVAAALGLRLWERPETAPAPAAPKLASVELVRGDARFAAETGAPSGKPRPLAPSAAVVAGDTLETGAGSAVALRLAGGSSLRLDADSRVRLISASRVALERGALYVDSGGASDPSVSIAVETPYATVHEIGTQFEVRLLEENATTVRVRVREGEVELRDDGALAGARAGEELGWTPGGTVRRTPISLSGDAWSWVVAAAPSLEIEGRTLDAFLGWLARETGWRVAFENETLAASAETIRLHGSIAGLSPEQAVSVVLPGSGLAYRLDDGTLTVERAASR